MNLKLLPVVISLFMMPALSHAVEVKVSADSKKIQDKAAADSKVTVGAGGFKSLLEHQTTRPTLVQPFMPTHRGGSWRFGVWRTKRGGYYHKGLDFSGNTGGGGDGVLFSDNGTYLKNGGGHNIVEFKRANEDAIVMLHADSISKGKIGSPVVGGNQALIMGRKGKNLTNVYDKHLHYEYHVLSSTGRQRFIGIGGTIDATVKTRGKGASFHTNTMGSQSGFSRKGYVVTDPAPYLKKDVVINGTQYDAGLEKYIGNSIRSQYNAVYRPNILLPLGAGAKAATKQFVNLPAPLDNMSPEDIAAMSGGAIDISMYAGEGGYGIDGQLMSQQMAASFISSSNGSDWAALPPTAAADLTESTPQEIVSKIQFQRFGNPEWDKALVTLSSKALLTEYTLMNAEENFLRQQNQKMKNRIELQIASLNQAQLFEYNKKIEAMNIMANAEAVPRIIDRELEQLPSGYYRNSNSLPSIDLGDLPDDLNGLLDALIDTIAQKEGPSHDAYNNGTACGKAAVSMPNGGGKFKPTQMTPVELIRTYKPTYKVGQTVELGTDAKCHNFVFASGFIQTIPMTLAELLKRYPEYANQLYTPENQRSLAIKGLLINSTRKNLKNFLRNGGDDKAFDLAMHQLSMEWSSIGVPNGYWRKGGAIVSGDGISFHDAGNKAHAKTTAMVRAVMRAIQAHHRGDKPAAPTAPPTDSTTPAPAKPAP